MLGTCTYLRRSREPHTQSSRDLANASRPHNLVRVRRLALLVAAAALVVVLVVGLSQAGRGDQPATERQTFDLGQARQRLQGAPAPLADLHEQANALLTSREFEDQLERLEGTPVVINKWASWCGPCRAEFPIFQRVATDRGKDVAFLGLNAADKRPAARGFLAERPLPYPSYDDPDEDIASDLRAAKYFPMTVFVDRRGEIAFVKAGEYRSAAELNADIDRYLG
jgi:cytochrome c biogenesis protein CcmG/thiol:disulfide interchange protein DsbE